MIVYKATVAAALSATLLLPANVLARTNSAPDPSSMSDDAKLERAKQLYGQADALYKDGDSATALPLFEEAYNVYAPNLHIFNFNIALAAYELGDCVKAKDAFRRFLDLVDDHPKRKEAQVKVLEIDRSGCANSPVAVVKAPTTAPVSTGPVDDDDGPDLSSRREERDELAQDEREKRNADKIDPLLLSGAILTGIGGLALVGSGVSLALANAKANRLADLASPGRTGFPDGDYGDDEVFNLDQNRLPGNNKATIALFAGGLVMAGVGVGLLLVGLKRTRENKLGTQRASLTGIGPALLPHGGGGATATVRF